MRAARFWASNRDPFRPHAPGGRTSPRRVHETFAYTSGPALAPYVEWAIGYRHSGVPAGIHLGMPSGSLTLVIPLHEALTLSCERDGTRTAFDAVVAGLDATPTYIHHDGSQHGIQLALRPEAALDPADQGLS